VINLSLEGHPMLFLQATLSILLMLIHGAGCTSTLHSPPQEKTDRSLTAVDPILPTRYTAEAATRFVTDSQGESDAKRLTLLWRERTQSRVATDYPLGPGDVLEVSVPGVQEITNRTVRVSGVGTIAFPLIGTIQASGLTEEKLQEEIRRRLAADYMHNPQVNIFVREYRSRQVAVIGAVARPGLYNLTSETDTVLNMISLAGGMTGEAAPRIHFIPAEPIEKEKARELTSTLPVELISQNPTPLLLKRTDPLVIDLKNLTAGTNQLYLALPVRPGDVLMVPGGGDVLIEGWVAKPGSYKVTPGLTVLGAVAATGGPLFAADTGSVKIIRTDKTGEKTFFLANLDGIKRGEQPDIPIQEGDIIEVSSSAPRLVPYSMYRLFTTVIHIGGSVPLF
jgi:polysaccharide export outer membrane protein